MRIKHLSPVIGLFAAVALIAAACGGDDEGPARAPTVVFSPTAAQAVAATATQPPVTQPTATQPPPTQAPAPPSGDAANGEKLFAANGCSACHSTGSNTIIGPGLAGVEERAATRVEGMSAEEYIEHSIRDPGAFVVDGFVNLMPATFGALPDSDIQDLIAYMATLQ